MNISGGEPESYEILGETELRPIINVLSDEEDVYSKLRSLILNPCDLSRLKNEGIEYIRRHHDYVKVAKCYETFYLKSHK